MFWNHSIDDDIFNENKINRWLIIDSQIIIIIIIIEIKDIYDPKDEIIFQDKNLSG